MINQQGLVVIVGPTAVGKSKLSVELAAECNGEIISADSMQIYRHMDIGTAKVTPDEMKGVPHWGIDIIEPEETFSVADYRELAENWLADIWGRGRTPFLVGGTGLYVRAVTEDYDFTDFAGDPQFRQKLEQEAMLSGSAVLHARLQQIDPATAARLHPNDLRRIIRALEIYEFTGQPMGEQVKQSDRHTRFPALKIGLTMRDRALLYDRINQRVDIMIEQGLLQEVEKLLEQGAHKELLSMQAIGYKEIMDFIENRKTIEQAVAEIKLGSRRYAKRQLSWFRRDPHIHWFEVDTMSWQELFAASFRLVKEFQHRFSNKVEIKEDGGTTS